MNAAAGSLRRRTLVLTYFEGSLFAVMVAAAEYFALYFAVLRGVNPLQVALLSTLPLFFGAIANIVVPQFVSQRALKPSILILVFTQIIGLALLLVSVTVENFFPWILSGLILYWLGGLGAGPLWMDWTAGWLPTERYGRFYSQRAAFLALVSLVFYLGTAWIVHWAADIRVFLVLFALALAARLTSWAVLCIQKSPPVKLKSVAQVSEGPRRWKNSHLWTIIIFAALFKLVANVSSPFFLPYEVERLGFGAFEVAIVNASSFLGMMLLMASFGEAMKHFQPILGLQIAMLMAALNCGLWIFVREPILASSLQFFSGLTWAVFDLACVLMIQANFPGQARRWVGLQLSLASIGTILGSLIGAKALSAKIPFETIILYSSILRFSIAIAFGIAVYYLPELRQPLKFYAAFVRKAFVMRLSFMNNFRLVSIKDLKD